MYADAFGLLVLAALLTSVSLSKTSFLTDCKRNGSRRSFLYYLSLPMKNIATVPGPEWEPITAPT